MVRGRRVSVCISKRPATAFLMLLRSIRGWKEGSWLILISYECCSPAALLANEEAIRWIKEAEAVLPPEDGGGEKQERRQSWRIALETRRR